MPSAIPDDLMARAYVARNGEAAWAAEDALKVIEWATASGIPVLGWEIWLPTTPGPTIPFPYIYTFTPSGQGRYTSWDPEHPPKSTFSEQANLEAAEAIRAFEWAPGDYAHHGLEPYFNLTLGDE